VRNLYNGLKTLYYEPSIMIKNNGWISESFKMKRGVRQGCPVSALLFIIAVEALAEKIKQDKNIQGIDLKDCKLNINSNEIKIIQYADDSILTIKDKASFKHAITLINEFTNIAGLKLNLDKCEIISCLSNCTIFLFFFIRWHRHHVFSQIQISCSIEFPLFCPILDIDQK